MTKVFSGGCVYEFWYGTNWYGLVKMRPRIEEYVREDPDMVVDRIRNTDWGILLVLNDFENYKAKLLETREMKPISDGTEIRKGDGDGHKSEAIWSATSARGI